MNNKLVIANWKMNGDLQSNQTLVLGIEEYAKHTVATEIVICPPFVYLPQVADLLKNSQSIKLGAQNTSIATSGAYTGEVSVEMLAEFNCQYVLIGHSERRALFGEEDQLIADKIKLAVKKNITPVLCVGESLEQREQGETKHVVLQQLEGVIELVGCEVFKSVVIAYEPIWAIGTGQTASAEQAQEVHAFIRNHLNVIDNSIVSNLSILYGGSVNETNADELIQQPDIDGFLVGGASLKVDAFKAICYSG